LSDTEDFAALWMVVLMSDRDTDGIIFWIARGFVGWLWHFPNDSIFWFDCLRDYNTVLSKAQNGPGFGE